MENSGIWKVRNYGFSTNPIGLFLLSTHLPPDPNEIILLKELNETKDTVIPRSL